MKILAWPAFANRKFNPYNALLYDPISKSGHKVYEKSLINVISRKYDVFHVHWPESLLTKKYFYESQLKVQGFFVLSEFLQKRNTKMIWTVHNLKPHDEKFSNLVDGFYSKLVERVNGLIYLTHASKGMAEKKYPGLQSKPWAVIPHGHYRDTYPDTVTKVNARAILGLDESDKVILCMGQIRRYKNIPRLLEAFRSMPDLKARLIIAGNPVSRTVADEILRKASIDSRVMVYPEHIQDDRVQIFHRAADVAVLPFGNILNSGSALLSLTFGVPVMLPDLGSMKELQETVGDQWVKVYPGELTESLLQDALTWALNTERGSPVMDALEWNRIAGETVTFYKKVIGSGQRREH